MSRVVMSAGALKPAINRAQQPPALVSGIKCVIIMKVKHIYWVVKVNHNNLYAR